MAKNPQPINRPPAPVGRPRSSWYPTSEACHLLGISRWTLANMRQCGTLRQGYHWKVKNPSAARLTYLWHVSRIETTQKDVLA